MKRESLSENERGRGVTVKVRLLGLLNVGLGLQKWSCLE